jgi:hypothetical protein
MKNLSFLIGRDVNRQAENEVNTLKQTLKGEKKDLIEEHSPGQTFKKDKKDFVRRFDMYLIYTDMNQRFGKSKGT